MAGVPSDLPAVLSLRSAAPAPAHVHHVHAKTAMLRFAENLVVSVAIVAATGTGRFAVAHLHHASSKYAGGSLQAAAILR